MSDSAFYRRLDQEFRSATSSGGARASQEILTRFWRGRFQRLGLFLAFILKVVGIAFFANRLKRCYQRYLDIVVGQRKSIAEETAKGVKYFEQWEWENRRYGCGRRETRELEHEAWERAQQAIDRMQNDLRSVGWPHRLKRVRELVPGYDGHLYNYSHEYWENLQGYLNRIVQRLS